MVPLPAQGHLNQLLHFSRLISSHHIPVHTTRVHGWDPLATAAALPYLHFHEFPMPPQIQSPPRKTQSDRVDIFHGGDSRGAVLPEGYEERIRDRGIVVRDWAPQLEILGHPATGGFVSHCGWNSCMESISMGVPVAAWPMHSDQPRNATLLTQVLRIGFSLVDWARRSEVVGREEVAKGVKKLMASGEGGEMRKRAVALSERVKESMMASGEGGEMRKRAVALSERCNVVNFGSSHRSMSSHSAAMPPGATQSSPDLPSPSRRVLAIFLPCPSSSSSGFTAALNGKLRP
ncbi:unnamed protein product [Cuscuta campestris]|uniref:Glycosyltransferase N-terminal domain-containing protein n=1 Tax=Cuscuta campestris TaxID=132261 RepID=A0A484MBL7_9ASTE|nr:unnamed protein product [Cuscuta campestris]